MNVVQSVTEKRKRYHSSQSQLANLKPFQQADPRRPQPRTTSKSLERAIREVRELAPAAVAFLGEVLKNPDNPMAYRMRAAETLLDKALGKGDKANSVLLRSEQAGPNTLRIVFVAPETNYDEHPKPQIEETAVELQWSDADEAKDAAKDG